MPNMACLITVGIPVRTSTVFLVAYLGHRVVYLDFCSAPFIGEAERASQVWSPRKVQEVCSANRSYVSARLSKGHVRRVTRHDDTCADSVARFCSGGQWGRTVLVKFLGVVKIRAEQ